MTTHTLCYGDGDACRRQLARAMGGEEGVAKQHAKGRLTLRERLNGMLDAQSFREVGRIAGNVDANNQHALRLLYDLLC